MRYHTLGAVSSGYKEVTVEFDIEKDYIVMSRELYTAPYRSNISISWKDSEVDIYVFWRILLYLLSPPLTTVKINNPI